FALIFAGKLINRGCKHAAGLAPFSPEIHQHGDIGLKNFAFKIAVGQFLYVLAGHEVNSRTERLWKAMLAPIRVVGHARHVGSATPLTYPLQADVSQASSSYAPLLLRHNAACRMTLAGDHQRYRKRLTMRLDIMHAKQ